MRKLVVLLIPLVLLVACFGNEDKCEKYEYDGNGTQSENFLQESVDILENIYNERPRSSFVGINIVLHNEMMDPYTVNRFGYVNDKCNSVGIISGDAKAFAYNPDEGYDVNLLYKNDGDKTTLYVDENGVNETRNKDDISDFERTNSKLNDAEKLIAEGIFEALRDGAETLSVEDGEYVYRDSGDFGELGKRDFVIKISIEGSTLIGYAYVDALTEGLLSTYDTDIAFLISNNFEGDEVLTSTKIDEIE